MLFVAAATIAAMLGEVVGYYGRFGEQWLLALMGSVILVCDVWIILEGIPLLFSDRTPGPRVEVPKPWT